MDGLAPRPVFSLLVPPTDESVSLPFDLLPGLVVDVPAPSEIELIRGFLEHRAPRPFHWQVLAEGASFRAMFESIAREVHVRGPGEQVFAAHALEPLDSSVYRYRIIRHSEETDASRRVHLAGTVCPQEMSMPATWFECGGMEHDAVLLLGKMPTWEQFASQHWTVGRKDLECLRDVANQIVSVEGNYGDIIRVLYMYYFAVRGPLAGEIDLPWRSLSLFAVIEALLTHKPRASDTGDSLTRQVKSKIPLLLHRTSVECSASQYFDDAPLARTWTALYAYRSSVAHGAHVEFAGELQLLRGAKNVHDYLVGVTKALLRHALVEPQLIEDLREC